MSPDLIRHLLKAAGLVTVFVAILVTTAIVLARLNRWFLRLNSIPIRSTASWFEVASRAFTELARRKTLSVIVVALACLVFRAVLLPWVKVPAPAAHDEFSYLLAGDTFAHRRLTNPTPPMWMHFESMHINLKPTYMSMYPPGQGLVLAVGQRLGHSWIAIWLMAGVGCAVICWALQGWLPPKWALLGGVFAVLQFGVLCYWANTYYCTWLPAIGGALVLGGLPRLRNRARVFHAVLLALGVVTLAMTRPYEGLVFCIPVAALLFIWILRPRRGTFRLIVSRIGVPIASILVLAAVFFAYYNFRVCGNALVMPYRLNQQTYAVVPLFLWQHLRSDIPVYHDPEMRNYYLGWELTEYYKTAMCGFAKMTWLKFKKYWEFYFGPLLTIPLMALPWVLKDKRIRFLLIVSAITIIGLEVEVWSHPHYAAPLTCVFLALVLQCMRHLQFWHWRSWQIGRITNWVVVLGCIAFDAAWVSAMIVHINDPRLYMLGGQQRATIESQLEQTPGGHLVFVHYESSHQVFREWVYNRADIAHAKVIWARDLGRACDEKLIREFGDRVVWLLDPDTNPIELEHYSPSAPTSTDKDPCLNDSGN